MPVSPINQGKLLIDQEVDDAPVMTEEMKHILSERMRELDLLLADKGKAKFKIEIVFASARSTWKPTTGMMSFWESGAKLSGGGDAKIYMCPGVVKDSAGNLRGKGPCGVFMPDASHGYGHLICPKCGTAWKEQEVVGEIVAKLSMQHWATLLMRYFLKLDGNADLSLKFSSDDVRSIAAQEQVRQRGGELLAKTREKRVRGVSVYPLANIIKDTSGGRDATRRFFEFLRA